MYSKDGESYFIVELYTSTTNIDGEPNEFRYE